MCRDSRTDLAVLAMVGSGAEGGAEVTFEHAEDRFDLPSLAVEVFGEAALHESAVVTVDGVGLAAVRRFRHYAALWSTD